MGKKFLKGEITTVVALGTLIILGVSSFFSSMFLNKKKQIFQHPKATETVSYERCTFESQGRRYIFFRRNGGMPVCDLNLIKAGTTDNPIDAWLIRTDVEVGQCRVVNNNANQQCGGNWDDWCYYFNAQQSGSRCLKRDSSCDNGVCLVNQQPTVQPTSNTSANNNNQSTLTTSACFSMTAEFEVRQFENRKSFYAWVKFISQRGGNIKLEYNGIHVAGWNRFLGGTFTYSPQWTQPHSPGNEAGIASLINGQSMPFTYRGIHSGCNPQDFILNCSIGVDQMGNPSVSGNGCICRNCHLMTFIPSLTPTPTPTPTPTQNLTLNNRQAPTPTPTPTPTSTPTPPLLTETGILANPGKLIIENVTNDKILKLEAISLQGVIFFNNYEYLSVEISPRQSYEYDYSRFCTVYRKILSGHIAYYSSEDNFKFVKFKSISLSCDYYLLIGID